MDILVLVDAESIGHGGDGSEGPAGTTTALVTDLTDGRAVGPLLAGVKVLGDVLHAEEDLLLGREELLVSGVDTHQVLDVVGRGAGVEVLAGLPRHRLAVDLVDEVLGDDVAGVGKADDGRGEQERHRFEHGGAQFSNGKKSLSSRIFLLLFVLRFSQSKVRFLVPERNSGQ